MPPGSTLVRMAFRLPVRTLIAGDAHYGRANRLPPDAPG